MVDFPVGEMDRVGEEFDGRFGIYVEELNSGATYGYCDNERFPTASVCKVTEATARVKNTCRPLQ